MNKGFALISLAALALSIVAFVLALAGLVRGGNEVDTSAVRREIYNQVLTETWAEVKPAYDDLGIRMPEKPESFRDLLRPLVGVTSAPVPGRGTGTTQPQATQLSGHWRHQMVNYWQDCDAERGMTFIYTTDTTKHFAKAFQMAMRRPVMG